VQKLDKFLHTLEKRSNDNLEVGNETDGICSFQFRVGFF